MMPLTPDEEKEFNLYVKNHPSEVADDKKKEIWLKMKKAKRKHEEDSFKRLAKESSHSDVVQRAEQYAKESSDVVQRARAAHIQKRIDGLLAQQARHDAQQARQAEQIKLKATTGQYWPGQSDKSQKHIKDNYLKDNFDPFWEED